jgi:TolB protein
MIPPWVLPVLLALCALLAAAAGFGYTQIQSLNNARATQTQAAVLAIVLTQTAAAPPAGLLTASMAPAVLASESPTGVTGGVEATSSPPVPSPTGMPTAQPLVVKVVIPEQANSSVDKQLVFRVQANDPRVGSKDGDGIANVDMRVIDPNGNVVHQRTEGTAGYCAFSGGEPDCNPFVFANHGYRWENGDPVQEGTYTLHAQVNAKDGRQQTVETTVVIHPLRRILYISQQDGPSDLYTIYADGSGGKRLTENAGVECCLSFSPDGKSAAFTSKRDGNQEIYTVSLSDGKFKNLTNHPDADIGPVWSPDGSHIAFLSNREAGGLLQVCVMNADGSGFQRLASTTGNANHPNWSPDGKKIAFALDYGGGNWDLLTVNVDGSSLTRLTTDPAYDGAPAFSPDGGSIAYISSRSDNTFKPFIMGADGSGQTLLANAPASGIFTLWDPDGQMIYFPSSGAGGGSAIFRVAPNGAGLAQVTGNDLSPGLFNLSPDGKTFSLMNGYNIYIVSKDGTQVKQLTNSPGIIDDAPLWQP